MQIIDLLKKENTAVYKQLKELRKIVSEKNIFIPKDDILFVFLCGGNVRSDEPSGRRREILKFAERELKNTKFFLAEPFFKVMLAEQNRSNLLDLETDITKLVDFIVIILESESAFCELGAFSTDKDLRKKTIIINDNKFENSDSFISKGPIQAIREENTENILSYKMEDIAKEEVDGIGEVFNALSNLLDIRPRTRRSRLNDFNPNEYFNKQSLRFVHDIVFISSPIKFNEISVILKTLFGNISNKKLGRHLALLCATNQILRSDFDYYISKTNGLFYQYNHDIESLIASFKNLYYKYDKHRYEKN